MVKPFARGRFRRPSPTGLSLARPFWGQGELTPPEAEQCPSFNRFGANGEGFVYQTVPKV